MDAWVIRLPGHWPRSGYVVSVSHRERGTEIRIRREKREFRVQDAQRVLVIKLRAIGDVVLTLPMLEALRVSLPSARIEVLTEREPAPVLRGHPAVDEVLVFDRTLVEASGPIRAARLGWRLIEEVRSRHYDLVIDLFGNPRSAIVTYFSAAPLRVGFDWRIRRLAYNRVVPSRADRVHEVEFNLDALRALGLDAEPGPVRLPMTDEARREARLFFESEGLFLRPVVALNPGGGWVTKRWPVSYYAQLAARIVSEFGRDVLVLWGPGEIELAREVAQRSGVPVHILPQTDLIGLAAYLELCEALVTNDSGPMHIAAAVGTPVVAIFGPTRPELQGPWGVLHRIVRHEGLPCLGCNLTDCRSRPCMLGLPVDQVAEALQDLLASGAGEAAMVRSSESAP